MCFGSTCVLCGRLCPLSATAAPPVVVIFDPDLWGSTRLLTNPDLTLHLSVGKVDKWKARCAEDSSPASKLSVKLQVWC